MVEIIPFKKLKEKFSDQELSIWWPFSLAPLCTPNETNFHTENCQLFPSSLCLHGCRNNDKRGWRKKIRTDLMFGMEEAGPILSACFWGWFPPSPRLRHIIRVTFISSFKDVGCFLGQSWADWSLAKPIHGLQPLPYRPVCRGQQLALTARQGKQSHKYW